ncbi:helix-turn-helix domain-containing protein [Candidatus Woesearchaeota archaeon]|nr:helix-turn-helix domain-containing protein [Candidatus Woesearchaeota archaeon]
MQEKLVKLGLSKNEATIYLFLLKNPNITTGLIIKETGISNSRVYESLNSLISKGLVSYIVQKEGKSFNASPPEKFLEKEEERKKQIEELVPELKKLKEEKKFRTNTAVFEGFEGFKTAFKKIIDDCPKEETIYVLGFSEQPYATESLRIFLTNMNLKSLQKKQKLKILLDSSVRETLGKDREKEKNTEVKYMPKGYISPSAIDIFEDYVYIFLWEEKPFVFMIKNRRIAESFKQYFNFLWKIAKK